MKAVGSLVSKLAAAPRSAAADELASQRIHFHTIDLSEAQIFGLRRASYEP